MPIEGTVVGSWDEIEEKEFTGQYEVLTPGQYDFYLMDCEKRVGEESGNEYVALSLVHEREEQPDEPEGTQHKFYVWENLHFTPKMLGQTKRVLRLMGVDTSCMAGITLEPGVVPDELMDAIEDAKDTGTFPIRVKKTRYKAKDSDEMKYRNEVARWIETGVGLSTAAV